MNFMKALLITVACLVLALILRIADDFGKRARIKSVGAKSNEKSKNIATIDLSDNSSVMEGLAHYKDLLD